RASCFSLFPYTTLFRSNCYSQRSLNQFYGNHQTLIALHGIENSFNAVQCASANADSLADVQKRMLPDRNLLSQNRSNGRNFALRDRKSTRLNSSHGSIS